MEPFIGQILMFAGNFAPRGWALCDGQLLPISSNQALFSILGTTYGGDGRTTFSLPDLRGRTPIHAGSGPGLTPRRLGSRAGQETVTLNTTEIPSHTHSAKGKVTTGTDSSLTDVSQGNYLAHEARGGSDALDIYTSAPPVSFMADDSVRVSVDSTGGGQAHQNMPPYLTINYIIALQGIYPPRS